MLATEILRPAWQAPQDAMSAKPYDIARNTHRLV
jgi:hypothetical protein